MSKGILHVSAQFTIHTPDLDDDRLDIESAIHQALKTLGAQSVKIAIVEQVEPGESA